MKRRTRKQAAADLKVGRSSAGLGLYALRPFKKGERIIEYVGRTLSEAETYTSRSKYLFEVTKYKTIDGKPLVNMAGYINHSCRPNAEAYTFRDHVYIKARRAIAPGEELTYDYGREYWNEYIKPHGCRCAKCARVA